MTKSHRVSHFALLMLGALIFLPVQDYSLRVDSAVAPLYPTRAYGNGVVVIGIEMNRSGRRIDTEIISGELPFSAPALKAVTHWKFSPSPSAATSRTSITFVFRPRTMDRVPLRAAITDQQKGKTERPALPAEIFDTGYPQTCSAEGSVILDLSINQQGEVDDLQPIIGDSSLIGAVELQIRSWKFFPARANGKAVRGNAIVVISFVHPAL